MSDRLDTLLDTVGPLLRRVDDVLSTGGAPPEHPVWREIRRVRLLPWDAVLAVAALRPDVMREAVTKVEPSFLRLCHSPCHEPVVFSCSMTPATIRLFSSGG